MDVFDIIKGGKPIFAIIKYLSKIVNDEVGSTVNKIGNGHFEMALKNLEAEKTSNNPEREMLLAISHLQNAIILLTNYLNRDKPLFIESRRKLYYNAAITRYDCLILILNYYLDKGEINLVRKNYATDIVKFLRSHNEAKTFYPDIRAKDIPLREEDAKALDEFEDVDLMTVIGRERQCQYCWCNTSMYEINLYRHLKKYGLQDIIKDNLSGCYTSRSEDLCKKV